MATLATDSVTHLAEHDSVASSRFLASGLWRGSETPTDGIGDFSAVTELAKPATLTLPRPVA